MTDAPESSGEDLHREVLTFLESAPKEELLILLQDIAKVRPELIQEVSQSLANE